MQGDEGAGAYDGDEEGVNEHNDEGEERLEDGESLKDKIVNLSTDFLARSNLKNASESVNKRKAQHYPLDDRAVRRQKLENQQDSSKSPTPSVQSHRQSRRRLFDERDIQELGQAIAMQVTSFVDQRLRELGHSAAYLQAPGQTASRGERITDENSREQQTTSTKGGSTSLRTHAPAQHLMQQAKSSPQHRSLWASSKPLTPAAEVRRGYALSHSRVAEQESNDPWRGQEQPIDPALLHEDQQTIQQNQQQHEVLDGNPFDESSSSIARRTIATKAPGPSDIPVKDESDDYLDPDEAQPYSPYNQAHDSIEFPAAESPPEYSANTKRRLEQTEQNDTSPWWWTEEQDSLLLRLKNVDNKEWSEVVKHFPTRSYRTIQQRYYNLMKPAREDSQLHKELARQKALNRNLMRENAAYRGGRQEDSATEELLRECEHRDNPSSREPLNENGTDDQNGIDPASQDDHSIQNSRPEHVIAITEQAGEEDTEQESNINTYPDPEDVSIDPYLFSQRTGQGRDDQRILSMVTEDELPNGYVGEAESVYTATWTEEEDELVLHLREVEGLAWKKIAERLSDKDEPSIRKRYSDLTRAMPSIQDPAGRIPRQGSMDGDGQAQNTVGNEAKVQGWTISELERLRKLKEVDQLDWATIAEMFPGRAKQNIRRRYYLLRDTSKVWDRDHEDSAEGNAVKPRNSDQISAQRAWGSEEEWALHRMRDIEKKSWNEICAELPHRTRGAIQLRYYTIIKELVKKSGQRDTTNSDRRIRFEVESGSQTSNTPEARLEQTVPQRDNPSSAIPPVAIPQQPGRLPTEIAPGMAESSRTQPSKHSLNHGPTETTEPSMNQPWKAFPITPSTINPHTNQPWTPIAMSQPLFPPKQSTDELLRAIAGRQLPVTPTQSPNQPWRQDTIKTETPVTPRPSQYGLREASVTQVQPVAAGPRPDPAEEVCAIGEPPVITQPSPDRQCANQPGPTQPSAYTVTKEPPVSADSKGGQNWVYRQLLEAAIEPGSRGSSHSSAPFYSPEPRSGERIQERLSSSREARDEADDDSMEDLGSEDELAA